MFVIMYIQNDAVWYLVEAERTGKAMWSKKWNYSRVFPTKAGAEQFKRDYLSDRNCAVISLDDEGDTDDK